MTETTTNPNPSSNIQPPAAPPAPARCGQRTRLGRRCRLPVADPATGLCGRHFQMRQQLIDSADLSAHLFDGEPTFQSIGDVFDFLTNLLILQVKGLVSIRRAAVLCYIAGQLLRSFREVERNTPIQFEFPDCAVRPAAAVPQEEPRAPRVAVPA